MAIGSTMAAVIGAGASVAGGVMQAGAARDAADAQTQAAQDQMALQREMFDTVREDVSPFRQAGGNALAAYLYELGLGDAPMLGGNPMQIQTIPGAPGASRSMDDILSGMNGLAPDNTDRGLWQRDMARMLSESSGQAGAERFRVGGQEFATREEAEAFARQNPTGGQQYQGIDLSPAARFAMEQGRDTVEAGASSRGGLRSGATMAGLERLRMGMAAQDRENQLGRLAGLTDMGMGAASMNASNANAFASMGSQSLANMGNAQAAGAVGAGNAWNNAFGNLAGIAGYMARPQAGQFGGFGQPAIGRQGSLY